MQVVEIGEGGLLGFRMQSPPLSSFSGSLNGLREMNRSVIWKFSKTFPNAGCRKAQVAGKGNHQAHSYMSLGSVVLKGEQQLYKREKP